MAAPPVITGTRLYLDAKVLIYAAEGGAALSPWLRDALLRVDTGELSASTSELTPAEVLVKPLRDGNVALVESYKRRLISGPTLSVLPVSRAVLTRAAELRATTASLKLPDAIHAATALLHGCTTFLINDTRFTAVPGLPLALLSPLP